MKYEQVEVNSERWYDLTPLLNEEFRDITGYEGYYQVSNYSRVKALSRIITHYNGFGIYEHQYKEKILKQTKQRQGYLMVGLTKNCKQKRFLVHRLVGEAFIPNPNNLPVIDHIKEMTINNCNNRVDNLRWSTQSDNMKHCVENNRISHLKGKLNAMSKTVVLLDDFGNIIKEYESERIASQDLNLSVSTINNYVNGKNKIKQYNLIFKEEYYEK